MRVSASEKFFFAFTGFTFTGKVVFRLAEKAA